MYDSELNRRVQARLHPVARADLTDLVHVSGATFNARGQLTFHGVTRDIAGALEIRLRDDGSMVVEGEQTVDIRDFDVPPLSMLMLKIEPAVRVHIVIHGRPLT